MLILLDTHIAVWAVLDDPRLSASARDSIEDARNDAWVSAASLWEIAIKFALGGRRDPMPFSATDAMRFFLDAGFQLLDIRPQHAIAVEQLPALHPDPFDRLLIAQAKVEPMHLLTHDQTLARYGAMVTVV